MRGEAMKRICEKLKGLSIDMSEMRALEFFAREGDWQTVAYADKVGSLEAWEIDPQFEPTLRRNLPGATILIGDSYEMAGEKGQRGRFGFIVFDNPQVLFGPGGRYCEHFEALELVSGLLAPEGVVILNVNRRPFDYDKHSEWHKRRDEFYGLADTSAISSDFLLSFYEKFFLERGMRTIFSFVEHRNEEYLSYMVFGLAQTKHQEKRQ